VGQRQNVDRGRECGGEVRKREMGEVREMGGWGGKVQGAVVVVGLEEPLVEVSVGEGLLFTRFRAGASIMKESRPSSLEAFRFFEGGWLEAGDVCSSWGVIVVHVSMVVVMVVVTVIVLFSIFCGGMASFFITAGRNPGVPA